LAPQVLVTHSAAAVQLAPLAAAQVLRVALHSPLAQAALTPLDAHVACSPSAGSARPTPSFAVQVKVLRAQNWPLAQSPSTQQLVGEGTQVPTLPLAVALHVPDWQLTVASAAVHGPSPLARPHRPLLPHTLVTHALAMLHSALFAPAHVLVVGLHAPVAHTAVANACEQTPWCSPSFGRPWPATNWTTHRIVTRSQNLPVPTPQSTSAQHEPAAESMHAPARLHTPDWHRFAVCAVQPVSPLAKPHLPWEHRLSTHCDVVVHTAPMAPAQVLVVGLQRPLKQVAAASVPVQAPPCSPSVGIAAPAACFATQA
jgi:hypothetical protein